MSSKPTEQVAPDQDETGGDDGPPEQGLSPGAVLDHGRYRLLSRVGSDARCDAELWRAKDGVLGRDVALTILIGDRADAEAAASARRTLERAMHASTFNHVGVARVLDVVTQAPGDPHGVLGVVIAEWTHGTSLVDLVSEGPLHPGTAARLLQPLAAAVEAAHHAGLVLGADHPQRIRVTPEGEIRMAFPGPLAKATSSEDVRGLGACLYLLLTGRWALSGGPDGLPTAPTGPDGTVVAPRTLRPTVPLELSTVSLRALGSPDSTGTTGGVRTGAAVLRVLEQHATFDAATPVTQAMAAGGDTRENDVWRTEDPKPDQNKRKKLMISVGVLSVATLLVVGWITASVIGIFLGGNPTGPGTVVRDGPQGQQPPQAARLAPAGITAATPFNPSGEPDSPNRVRFLFDGNATTFWTTADYNQQFGPGGITTGSGAVLSLAAPTAVREVTIDSPTPNTQVEIRAVTSPQPGSNTGQLLASATLNGPKTTIPINANSPTQHVLVLVTKLAPNDGKFKSTINEVTVSGAAP